MFTFNATPIHMQIPLIHVVDEDDQILLNSLDAEWFKILYYFPWEDYRQIAAEYYDALYHFNKSHEKTSNTSNNPENKEEATQRLLFDRATMDESIPVINQKEHKDISINTVSPMSIAPGITPNRAGGKKPKCFFSLFKSFLGTNLMGFPAEPETVYSLLTSNLPFARVCGFFPKREDEQYWHKYVPSMRKIEQFDQIMTEYGLWDKIKFNEVQKNIEENIIKEENELVGDTTHYHAYSAFKTIKYNDEKGKEKKKSQSKTTKNCQCEDKENCPHPWVLADDGAGTIIKAHNKMIWGHKASILGLPQQGIPLDAIAVSDASTFDGETLYPHVVNLFENLPETKPWINRILYDSACDSKPLKNKFKDEFDIDLKTSLNPRRKKTITENLPKGMEKLTPYGNLTCNAGIEMDYKGIRYESEKFIYQAPVTEADVSACDACENKSQCCPNANNGRIVNIAFEKLSHINPNDPPMAKRFKAIMTRRPSVERMIKRLKCDLSDDRLTKRGNKCFQAYLDKTMIAFHILLRN